MYAAMAGMTSATGRCHTFDEAADGYVRSEGCGALVLRRAKDALADDQYIHAIVSGVGVAHDGMSASLTAPNGRAQERLIRSTLREAGITMDDVDYLEAHGTGTILGDPVEMGAVAAVVRDGKRDQEYPLMVGAVKANIGHLEPAAGIAGVIKAVLVLQNELAPPNAELKCLNPKISEVMKGAAIRFPTSLESLRLHRGKGEAAFAATVIREGQITLRALRVGTATTAGQIKARLLRGFSR
jgi:acyl transferase domain-containing protein